LAPSCRLGPTGGRRPAHRDELIDVLLGATWYRLLTEHAPLDEAFATALATPC